VTLAGREGRALAGADVLMVGYFSAKQKDYALLMDQGAENLTALGARVVGRFVQRRGVSDGGVRKMTLPYSSRTLVSTGKAREIAAACQEMRVDAVVFLNALTEHQRRVLSEMFGCPAVSAPR
jgi:50S ribosomal subunit-associated GTPase HflX